MIVHLRLLPAWSTITAPWSSGHLPADPRGPVQSADLYPGGEPDLRGVQHRSTATGGGTGDVDALWSRKCCVAESARIEPEGGLHRNHARGGREQ